MHGEAESFEQSGVQCFEDLRRSVEIVEEVLELRRRVIDIRRGETIETSSGTPAASPTYCFYEVNLFSSYGFCLDFKKNKFVSFMKT